MTVIHKSWVCKIGEVHPEFIPQGGDFPMRQAIAKAYKELTGEEPTFIFSGWQADALTEPERAVVENRPPSEEHYQEWLAERSADVTGGESS